MYITDTLSSGSAALRCPTFAGAHSARTRREDRTKTRIRVKRERFRGVNNASLAAFRIAFGLMMFLGTLRFALKGWIDALYIQPTFHFAYPGFEWIQAWPAWGMYLHFALMGLAALGIALGFLYRLSTLLFFLLFTYVELIDQTTYLNHYYLVSLLSVLMIMMPLHQRWSVDVWRKPQMRAHHAPAWVLWTLRLQLALVYIFAGLAKLKSDWLLRGEPLHTWLHTFDHLPWIGGLLAQRSTAIAMSWAGFLFDLSIIAWLLWRRTRPWAYFVLLVFHLLTAMLFNIGIFPWVMSVVTTLFFAPDWPLWIWRQCRQIVLKQSVDPEATDHAQVSQQRTHRFFPAWQRIGLAIFFSLQLLIPLRQYLYPGYPCWTERGYRFAWNVMLMEKTGQVTYRVQSTQSGRQWVIHPRETLSTFQQRMLSTQPMMIVSFARYLKAHFAADGVKSVRIYADAWASLNGRPSQRLIDPKVDLTQVSLAPWADHNWIVPLKTTFETP